MTSSCNLLLRINFWELTSSGVSHKDGCKVMKLEFQNEPGPVWTPSILSTWLCRKCILSFGGDCICLLWACSTPSALESVRQVEHLRPPWGGSVRSLWSSSSHLSAISGWLKTIPKIFAATAAALISWHNISIFLGTFRFHKIFCIC